MGINDGEASIEILYFNEFSRLQAQICNFLKIDITQLSPEKIQIFQVFLSWLLRSIIFDVKQNSWKYKNLSSEEKGSFTFAMKGPTFAHLLSGGDRSTAWTYFDFDAYESGFLYFIEDMGLEFFDPSQVPRQAIEDACAKIHALFTASDTGLSSQDIENIDQITHASKEHMFSRSSCMDLLAHLGLDYGADSEGVCEIPMKYTLI